MKTNVLVRDRCAVHSVACHSVVFVREPFLGFCEDIFAVYIFIERKRERKINLQLINKKG